MGKSTLQIPKVCPYCKNVFLAKTIKTIYCSKRCNDMALSEKRKQERKLRIQTELLNSIKAKGTSFITITQALQIFTTTRSTIRRMILTHKIESRQISPRKIFVCVESLEALFPLRPEPLVTENKKQSHIFDMNPEHCYTIGEISKLFHITDDSVYKHIRQFSIPTRQVGNYVYAPKSEIEKLYNNKTTKK